MMTITVLAVGKIREAYLAEAAGEYAKRIGRCARLKIVETEEEKTPENASEKEKEQAMAAEGKRLLARLPQGAYAIALDIRGDAPDSMEFAQKLESLGTGGTSSVCFLIGGPLGLSPDVLGRADERLSFSRMTFPHRLMRVILLEQIYRAFRILRGEPYHR